MEHEKETILSLGNNAEAVIKENAVIITSHKDGLIITHQFIWEDGALKAVQFESKKP